MYFEHNKSDLYLEDDNKSVLFLKGEIAEKKKMKIFSNWIMFLLYISPGLTSLMTQTTTDAW